MMIVRGVGRFFLITCTCLHLLGCESKSGDVGAGSVSFLASAPSCDWYQKSGFSVGANSVESQTLSCSDNSSSNRLFPRSVKVFASDAENLDCGPISFGDENKELEIGCQNSSATAIAVIDVGVECCMEESTEADVQLSVESGSSARPNYTSEEDFVATYLSEDQGTGDGSERQSGTQGSGGVGDAGSGWGPWGSCNSNGERVRYSYCYNGNCGGTQRETESCHRAPFCNWDGWQVVHSYNRTPYQNNNPFQNYIEPRVENPNSLHLYCKNDELLYVEFYRHNEMGQPSTLFPSGIQQNGRHREMQQGVSESESDFPVLKDGVSCNFSDEGSGEARGWIEVDPRYGLGEEWGAQCKNGRLHALGPTGSDQARNSFSTERRSYNRASCRHATFLQKAGQQYAFTPGCLGGELHSIIKH